MMSTSEGGESSATVVSGSSNSTAEFKPASEIVPTRDRDYYYNDGDCILRVQDTLFKLHRFMLTRHSLYFRQKLVELDKKTDESTGENDQQDNPITTPAQGTSDEHPIRISAKADAFRTLCWALYAMPDDIRAQDERARVDFDKLMLLCRISKTYRFSSLWNWSSSVLRSHWERPKLLQELSLYHLKELHLFSSQYLIGSVREIEKEWLSRVPAFLTSSQDLSSALRWADKIGGKLKAHTYHKVLDGMGKLTIGGGEGKQGIDDMFDISRDGTRDDVMADLPREQAQRSYKGLWGLLSLGQQLRTVPHLEQGPECSKRPHSTTCLAQWRYLWKENPKVREPRTIDPAAIIAEALERYEDDERETLEHANCYELMGDELRAIEEKFKSKLPQYFE
ncbi:hypothetical protein AN958_04076 [Leucoagaricus sp. SymC.cos]|nr:hypothetical protein AN958_04076 [Leucoagaricus sp. SymC.cos]